MVAEIARTARRLRVKVVAEGIQDDHQLAILRTLGVPTGQGFLMSPAVPASVVTEALTAQAAAEQTATDGADCAPDPT